MGCEEVDPATLPGSLRSKQILRKLLDEATKMAQHRDDRCLLRSHVQAATSRLREEGDLTTQTGHSALLEGGDEAEDGDHLETRALPEARPPPPPCPKTPTPMLHHREMMEHLTTLRHITETLVERGYPVPRVCVCCEFSAQVADKFQLAGMDVMTCDMYYESASADIPHFRGDALQLLEVGAFELVIAFPPCTFLSNAQTRYLVEDPTRWAKMEAASDLIQAIYYADAEFVCIENPKMSPYARDALGIAPTQVVHPHEHGHPESKSTLLFTRNLPLVQVRM